MCVLVCLVWTCCVHGLFCRVDGVVIVGVCGLCVDISRFCRQNLCFYLGCWLQALVLSMVVRDSKMSRLLLRRLLLSSLSEGSWFIGLLCESILKVVTIDLY